MVHFTIGATHSTPGDECRETSNGPIAVGDNARLFRELNFKQLQMDLIFLQAVEQLVQLTACLPVHYLVMGGPDPAARSAQPLGTPVGPFNAFNTVVYEDKKQILISSQ